MNKKKIKNLTKEELESICNKHHYCDTCPLEIKVDGLKQQDYSICIKHAIELIHLEDYIKRIDLEIEVEDEDRK